MFIIRLLEYEAKEVFAEFDLPLVTRLVIVKGEDVDNKLSQFVFPAIVKSQIAIGSRKKAGLIKIVQTREEGISLCKDYFTRKVGTYEVEAIL
ncbi:MAG: ATP-grasp domain-containing protein, partial [Candidatus Hodarchaeales archaeon]